MFQTKYVFGQDLSPDCTISLETTKSRDYSSTKVRVKFLADVKGFKSKNIVTKKAAVNEFRVPGGDEGSASDKFIFNLDSRNEGRSAYFDVDVEVAPKRAKFKETGEPISGCGPITIRYYKNESAEILNNIVTPEEEATSTPTSSPTMELPAIAPTFTSTIAATATSTRTAQNTPTRIVFIPTYTATNTPSRSATNTPSRTATNTASRTATNTPSRTATNTATATFTPTYTATASKTPVITATATKTSTIIPPLNGEVRAFPGAEGFGAKAVGGSGRHLATPNSTIYKVSSLKNSGAGTLRECIEASGPRICIFEVGGVIWATKALKISNPYITIAGQTAPSPGIIIRGSGISNETSNVVVQHIKIRPGDDPRADCCRTNSCSSAQAQFCTQDPGSRDGVNLYASNGPISNIIYDHVSISWALDEGFSIAAYRGDVSNVTISNSAIHSTLDLSIHPEASSVSDPGHSKGVLLNGPYKINNLSFAKNILAHQADRNVRVATHLSMEYVNNIIYNWGRGRGAGRLIEATNTLNAKHMFDLIGNAYIPGPDTFCPETQYRPELCSTAPNGVDSAEDRQNMHYILRVGSGVSGGLSANSRYYVANNDGPTRTSDQWSIVDKNLFTNSSRTNLVFSENKSNSRVAESENMQVLDTALAFEQVLDNAGALRNISDPVEEKLVNEIRNRSGRIVNCVDENGTERCNKNAGGWPVYNTSFRELNLPSDPFGDQNGNGYTNLEEWLFSFAQ